jgi:hypothetical protein
LKYLITLSLFFTSLSAGDIKKCSHYESERDCKFNEANNCSWISGEEICVSRSKGNQMKNNGYSNYHNDHRRKNGHHGHQNGHGRR